ncbi:hypothetical protein [Gluconobacter oxydans]|uniref:hypothetical protein n=1 Tax=Gluconobacter oxydans TaxID=442 RepID=UPI001CD89928|nr:hypothetical protein [Gluconobacter oxydans]
MTSLDGFLNGPKQADRLQEILRLEEDLDTLFSEKMKKLHQVQSEPEAVGKEPGITATTPPDSDVSTSGKINGNIDEKIELKKKIYDFKKTCWEMENARLNRSLAEFAAIFTAGGFLIPYWTYNVSAIKKNDPNIMPWVVLVTAILFVGGFVWYVCNLSKTHRSATDPARAEKPNCNTPPT